jgi:hypothetical protein
MRAVTCRLESAHLATTMTKMRQWLDLHESHVKNFEYYKLVDGVIVAQLDFANEGDAYEFATEFDGETAL